jgi:hypothetical protein
VVVENAQQNPADRGQFNPGGAAVRSLLLPGLGQFYTKQSGLGAAFLAVASGAAVVGVTVTKSKVECAVVLPQGTSCPTGYELRHYKTRPLLIPAIAGYVTLGVVSALQAKHVAQRATTRRGDSNDGYRPALGMFVDESAVGIGLSWQF